MTRKDLEEIKPKVDKIISKVLGSTDASIVTVVMNCVSSGHDARKICEKLCSLIDMEKASKIADRSLDVVLRVVESNRTTTKEKRSNETVTEDNRPKKQKPEENGNGVIQSAPKLNNNTSLLSEVQIKDMMMNAQKMIEERKKALTVLRSTAVPPPPPATVVPEANVTQLQDRIASQLDKQKKIQQLQSQIQSKLSTGVLKQGQPAPVKMVATDKPAPLILDSEGRTVDGTGKEVQLTHVAPTLKANIRARKREEFKQQLQEKPVEDLTESNFFDSRISAKPSLRAKRSLKFHEPGKFQQLAERMRMKARLEKLQNEISQIAKKTGISSATKLAQITPKEETQLDEIPDVEWWDSVILEEDSYYGVEKEDDVIKMSAINNLVEHPAQMKPPTDPLKPIYMPVFLTKDERKKLRRQNRRETWKEEQEKIRLGLEPPPEPKLRISNLMRVLGSEATQDPTKMEAHVRAQMAKRQKAHEEANALRKLTPEQRREKKIRKITEDTTLGVHVSVYRVNNLSNQSHKFKVETNAKQLFMTGGVIMFHDCNIIIVEGGSKQQNKFKRLMLHRIKWDESNAKAKDGKEVPNKCILVWEGMNKQRNFGEMKFKVCATEKLAREQLKKHGVEQYWDLAYSKSILDLQEDK